MNNMNKERVIIISVALFSYMLGSVISYIGGTQHPDCNFLQWFFHFTPHKWDC